MPADLNDYFKKKSNNNNSGGGGSDNMPPPEFLQNFNKKAGWLYAIIIIVAILLIAKPFTIINSGEVGIMVTAGKYEKEPLYSGFHFYIPFIQKVIVVDTKERVINYLKSEDTIQTRATNGIKRAEAIDALDMRGLTISIDISIHYMLNAKHAPLTIASYGVSWEEKIINPIVRGVVRSVIGSYKAEDLPMNRGEIENKIINGIKEKISAIKNSPVKLTRVNLRRILLPQKIKDQIEKVQIAKQEADRAKIEVEKANQIAQKKAALARGVAQANRIRAKGIADATKIEAQANAYANKIISESLTEKLLKLRQIEVQGKFNEALQINKDAKIFLTPGGAVPNIWVETKDKKVNSSIGKSLNER